MGNNSSIPERIQQNKHALSNSNEFEEDDEVKNQENSITAEYVFHETDKIQSLPPVDEPIRIINNPTYLSPELIKENREKLNNENIQKFEPIYDQAIKLISNQKDIVIDEYDFNTLISLIVTLTEDHNILIISPNSLIGKIYENFNETSSEIGIITDNLTKTQKSNIVDIVFLNTIDLNQYRFFILVIDESISMQLIKNTIKIISSKEMQVIIYRVFPSNGYADDVILEEISNIPEHLIAMQTKYSNCSIVSNIDFNNCINLTFNSIDEANKLIKTSAYRQGFEISVRDSLQNKENRIRFQCKCSKRKNPDESCPFFVYLKYSKKTGNYYIKKCDPQHNHRLNPELTQYKLLTSKQIRLILSLKRNKMPIVEINKTLNDIYDLNINITNRHIRKMKRKGKLDIDKLETTELEENTIKKGGIVRIKEDLDDKGRKRRTAILVIDEDEYKNLLSPQGNPIFIDGTAVPNRLNWELTLITLVDRNLGIQPGGSLFSAYTNKETFDWFLNEFIQLIKGRTEVTLITDEDLAISSSIISQNNDADESQPRIIHVLCAWHKTMNFEKKLTKCNFNDDDKEAIKLLWKRICYSPKKEVVISCIDEIKKYDCYKLNHYLEKHVVPLLSKFSRAFIPVFTAGYNVTSLSESANSMLKRNLTSAYYTLYEIKDMIRRSYFQKNIVTHERLIASQRGGSFLDEKFGLTVAPNIEEKLILSLLKSFRLQECDENKYIDPYYPDEIFEIDIKGELPICECGKVKYSGLPCSHLMKWSLDHKINPMLQISERYLDYSPSYTEISDYNDVTGNVWKDLITNRYKNIRINMRDSQPRLKDSLLRTNPAANILATPPENNKTQIIRYNEIISYAKDLAKIASKSEDSTTHAINNLKSMINELTVTQANDDDDAPYDAVSIKKGRRPKKKRIKPSFEKSIKRKCKICEKLGYDSNHLIGLCKYYEKLKAIAKELKLDKDDGGKKCTLCKCSGHYSRNCPALKKLIEEIVRREEARKIDEDEFFQEQNQAIIDKQSLNIQ